ncbi:metallophosphoesterase family protein [Tropicibacter alexandrii]|uniref:metallophosphoesterase family protein n=1 Tax=Tropicibacter alexandrii TaxID=2267683 RepID=UPI000EF4CB6C|nr:metallophosphoesterase family protein [Tropicibacter alexandrii]
MNLFKKILGRRSSGARAEAAPFDAPLAPEKPFFAIGDIHGTLDPFHDLLHVIEQVDECPTVICVGDYIDRGERSAEILGLLRRLTQEFPDLVFCLRGNHEQMCIDFLNDPERSGPRWMRHGGLQTLASYGVAKTPDTTMTDLRDALAEAMGTGMIAWLESLPTLWQSGNVAVVHAGADPALPITEQSDKTLMWGHADFHSVPRQDGIWVVHGHTIVPQPQARDGRIAIDTGAYATGTLSGAYICENDLVFIDQKLKFD